MATFLTPDKTITTKNGLTIKQKIIPDSMVATKNVAAHVKKGQKMKPCKKLNDGTGKPRGITVHNTGDLKVASGTTPAEQYTRATFAGNMSGVVVHYYVYKTDIWQNLADNERGWHAADGSSRRKSQRTDGSKIGGNMDTISIECIGNIAESEKTTAKLAAYLCYKYDLNPATDIYTHNYFYAKKKCPIYIIPHWSTFLKNVKKYYDDLVDDKATSSITTSTTTEKKPTTTTKPVATTPVKKEPKIGDIVTFKGTKHYIGAGSSIGAKCKAGKAKITNIKKGYKHPYHLVRVSGGGSTVHGWVNAADIT